MKNHIKRATKSRVGQVRLAKVLSLLDQRMLTATGAYLHSGGYTKSTVKGMTKDQIDIVLEWATESGIEAVIRWHYRLPIEALVSPRWSPEEGLKHIKFLGAEDSISILRTT